MSHGNQKKETLFFFGDIPDIPSYMYQNSYNNEFWVAKEDLFLHLLLSLCPLVQQKPIQVLSMLNFRGFLLFVPFITLQCFTL